MKTMKSFTISMAVTVVLLIDLMSPTIVHAEDETPPPASETPVETTTPPVTPLPTDIAPTET
ncbi:MAG TPA: hypothetical protein VN843_05945, partial [Anaerolineales bacterium]|nr:hypothetical protein [Anaerolineales bacterium]